MSKAAERVIAAQKDRRSALLVAHGPHYTEGVPWDYQEEPYPGFVRTESFQTKLDTYVQCVLSLEERYHTALPWVDVSGVFESCLAGVASLGPAFSGRPISGRLLGEFDSSLRALYAHLEAELPPLPKETPHG